jgi:integrase
MPDSEIEFLTAHEVERLAAVIQQPYGALVHLLAYGGLRFGEAAALRRGRCDLERGRITVRESLADVSGTLSFGTTKTHQARNVVLPRFLVEELRKHFRDHVAPGADALVFTSATGQPIRYGNFYRRVWKPATEAIGRPYIGVHVLRHTCASLLIAQGAPIKAIQAQLGHRSAELTLDRYGHLYPDQVAALASRLDDARAAVFETDDGHGYAGRRPDRGSPSDGARVGHAESDGNYPDIIG